MHSQFEELNLYVYNAAEGAFYDCVIWCLGPLVDDSRRYSWFRRCLAAATCVVCRRVIRAED